MSRFALVTDGSVTLPDSFRASEQVAVAHDHISFGMDSYTPGVDLTDGQFYDLIRTRREPPSTSQPSLGDIRDAYEHALRFAKDVLVITVDATRSGTHATMATAAHSMLGRFAVVDSHSVSGAMGLIVMACARARQKGATLDDAEALARKYAERVRLLAYIDTLDFIKRSGRVPAIRMLIGSLLQIKPIIRFAGGEPEMIDRIRTRSRGLQRVRELMLAELPAGSRAQVYVLHTNAPDDARELGQWARRTFHCIEYFEQDAGPVLATHVGPGVVGMGFFKED
ncbi:MAG TPA: DegV family protein [Candidatus Limnocylindria bacterium]|nr:DegV family protein [Candidatus Limnocylindria bacterium]